MNIVDAQPQHIIELRDNLRESDAQECIRLGLSLRKATWRSFKQSIMCKAAIIDGRVAAAWGLTGVFLSDKGAPWLLTTPIVEKYPVLFVKTYRDQVEKMHEIFPRLENYVDNRYNKSMKMLALSGFALDEPVTINGTLFRRFHKEAAWL